MGKQDLQFFGILQFKTLCAVIEVMVPSPHGGVTAEETRRDGPICFFFASTAPSADTIKATLDFVEIALPIFAGEILPFTTLSTKSRRHVLEKLVDSRGMLRDVANCCHRARENRVLPHFE